MPVHEEDTVTTHTVKFDADEIILAVRKMYSLPPSANLVLRIPGGGDYSNMELDIRDFDSIKSNYTSTS